MLIFTITGTAGKYCKLYRCSIWNSNYWLGGTVNVTVTAVTMNNFKSTKVTVCPLLCNCKL
jgi:hypothetical protein